MPSKDPAAYRKSPKGIAARLRERIKTKAKRWANKPAPAMTSKTIQTFIQLWARS